MLSDCAGAPAYGGRPQEGVGGGDYGQAAGQQGQANKGKPISVNQTTHIEKI
jgi:hypothetical protein